MQRPRVDMTITQLTASFSAHQPRNTSPKDQTGGSTPFVENIAARTIVELEGNVNGDVAQDLTCSPQKGQNSTNHLPAIWPHDQLQLTILSSVSKCSCPDQRINNSFNFFSIELDTSNYNTGHLDFTNNSGVHDSLLQAPQAMAHESNQSEMPLGCSPYVNSFQGLVSKGSSPGKQAAKRSDHFNPVLSIKRKWWLSTYYQPSCSKLVLGEGVLQDHRWRDCKEWDL